MNEVLPRENPFFCNDHTNITNPTNILFNRSTMESNQPTDWFDVVRDTEC